MCRLLLPMTQCQNCYSRLGRQRSRRPAEPKTGPIIWLRLFTLLFKEPSKTSDTMYSESMCEGSQIGSRTKGPRQAPVEYNVVLYCIESTRMRMRADVLFAVIRSEGPDAARRGAARQQRRGASVVSSRPLPSRPVSPCGPSGS